MIRISCLFYFVSFTISILLLSSCQKEPSDIITEANCQLSKAHYYDENGNIVDSLIYTYTNNKLTQASNADGHMTLEYTDDKVTKRTLFAAGLPGIDGYDTFSYNSDGTLATIKSFYDFNGQVIQGEQYEFTYTAGKLVKYEIKYYDITTSQFEVYQNTIYTYNGNNITQAVVTDPITTEITTYTYKYDNNENYHIKNNSLFIDLAFLGEIDGSILPVVISGNNLTSIMEGTDEFVLSHKLDNKGNFSEWYFDSELAAKYLYDCK